MINVCIIGYGSMARHYHAQRLREFKAYTAYGAYDIDPAALAAAEENGLRVFTSPEAVAADKNVHAVLIATPNELHRPYAEFFAAAKKHIICEKPATLTAADYEAMDKAAAENGVVLQVHQNRRQDADYLTVKKVIQSGVLGKVYRIDSRVTGANGIPGGWRKLPACGGGMMLDWGVHLIDQLCGVGLGAITSVYAKYSYILGFAVDDGFFTTLQFDGKGENRFAHDGGVEVNVEVDTNAFIRLPRWSVFGTAGSLEIGDFDGNGRVVLKKDGDAEPVAEQKGNGLTKTMATRPDATTAAYKVEPAPADGGKFYGEFLRMVTTGGEAYVKPAEVVRVLKVMETAALSAKTSQVIHTKL
jgi:predicted dehydrogenase